MPLISPDLLLFLAIADAGGFSEAGRRLGMAPSTAARRMDGFERGLGTRLFARSTRGLGLTEAGRDLALRGRDLLARASSSADDLGAAERRPSGILCVSASISFGRKYVAPRLGAFRRIYPDLRVRLRLEDDYADLIEGGVDVAVRIGTLPDSSLRRLTLGPVRRLLCASPDYLARRGAPEHPRDIETHDTILVESSAGGGTAWVFRAGRFRPSTPAITVSTPEAAVAAACGGAGLAHVPNWLVADRIASGALVPLLDSFAEDRGAGLHLVWPEKPPAKTRAFIDFLRGALSPLFRAA